MVVFFRDFFKVIIVIIGILLLIRFSFNKDIGKLLAGLSIIGAAIALAARESLENLIASFIIFFDKPFYVGDVVKVQGITGTIEKIGLRSTRVRTDQKTFVTVPNKQMVDSIMDNLSLRTQRRADLRLEISLVTSQDTIQQLIEGIRQITAHPSIENRNVFFIDIVANAYVITVEYYTGVVSIQEFNQLKQTINFEILKLMERLQIELSGLNTDIRIVNSGVQV
jgi:MscS family membrane protein